MRTGAVPAVGAKYRARKNSKVLGHIGARGTAYWNVRLLDKLFDFDWGQVGAGSFGALRAHVNAGKLTRETLHAEMGEIVAGLKSGRENETKTILFWHRGLSLSDIALGHVMITKGKRLGIGQRLRFA